MEINVKKGKVQLELSIDEANILVASMSIVKDNTNIPVFIRIANEMTFKLSSAVTFISNMMAYKDGN